MAVTHSMRVAVCALNCLIWHISNIEMSNGDTVLAHLASQQPRDDKWRVRHISSGISATYRRRKRCGMRVEIACLICDLFPIVGSGRYANFLCVLINFKIFYFFEIDKKNVNLFVDFQRFFFFHSNFD